MKKLLKLSLSLSLLFAFTPATLAGNHAEKGNTHATTHKAKDIVATAVEAGSFKILAQALTAAGLVETLQGKGPFTVFAPTDAAFGKIPKATLDALLKDKEALKKVLLYHVVSGNVMAKDVVKLKSAKTVQGSNVAISVKGKTVKINNATVISADVKASNGVIHVIDTVIMPSK
jgi:uncharacterized surface protein with fasciclin (FAS1) repeats